MQRCYNYMHYDTRYSLRRPSWLALKLTSNLCHNACHYNYTIIQLLYPNILLNQTMLTFYLILLLTFFKQFYFCLF